jgi:hypothetical protein
VRDRDLDRDFIRAFESCTLPPEEFPHRAHVRLAWLYLREGSLLDALPRFVEGLKRYAGSLGASAKYHETVTWAYMFLIHERMSRAEPETFDQFAAANEDLFHGILGVLPQRDALVRPRPPDVRDAGRVARVIGAPPSRPLAGRRPRRGARPSYEEFR